MALVGLARVSRTGQETRRQHDVLCPVCVRVFQEELSAKLKVADLSWA